MDIPKSNEQNIPRLRNLHPSQFSYGALSNADEEYGTPVDSFPTSGNGSFSERVGSFVHSYSRTSMNFMAENVAVTPNTHEMNDGLSIYSEHRRASHDAQSVVTRTFSRKSGFSQMERPSLYFSQLDQVLSRHSTIADVQSLLVHDVAPLKKSSFSQSIFNSINILMGVGIIALPMGFRCAGWLFGILVFVFCCALTNHTAKLLAKCLETDSEAKTYGDLGALTFGNKGRIGVTIIFITELMTSSVALVVLLGDGIEILCPSWSLEKVRLVSYCMLTPMLFLPVRHLSYTSILGIMSAFCILIVLIFDGLSKSDAPGSLITPAPTTVMPLDWTTVPLSFGLFMASFAGHAVFPTVYRDMEDPKQFRYMVNVTYLVTTFVYFGVGACGYMMFGSGTMQEITQNLTSVPAYSQALNRFALLVIAVNPIAKYGLNMNPINLTWQLWLCRSPRWEMWFHEHDWLEPFVAFIGKLTASGVIVLLAYMVPEFHRLMGLLGAFFSFVISGIFPLVCHFHLFGATLSATDKLIDGILLTVASFMCVTGTLASFLS
ncbi:transmembrane amino acid transporter protein-domain-containing protein [Gongronella butleri]|nr:transmembrane amino acid transporter protein-domain-containing protein [Gongronella butleri]